MFFIGIDVAKRSHQASVTDISGNVIVKPFNFKNSSDGFTKFLSIVESNAIEKNDCTIGLESTGHYWYPLYFFLIENGFEKMRIMKKAIRTVLPSSIRGFRIPEM